MVIEYVEGDESRVRWNYGDDWHYADLDDLIRSYESVKHGHWVTEEEAIAKDEYWLRDTCSVCGHCDWDCTESENFYYCPNCGAKMDGGEEYGVDSVES